jgi:N6-L-threonylcarbamoyladenine synthase
MEALANTYSGKIPKPRICVKNGNCNLSGLQNLAEKLWRESNDKALVSAYVFSFVAKTLEAMTQSIDERYGALPIVYAGGVMSNLTIQGTLGERPDTYFAKPDFSADNAAGTALLCRQRYLNQN